MVDIPCLPTSALFLMVGLGGLEPPTSSLSGMRSSHLSYRPRRLHTWWSWSGSNRRPPECKSGALPAELQPLNFRARCRKPLRTSGTSPTQINRGQLDAGTEGNQSLATSEKLSFSKWRSGSDSPLRPKPLWRFGLERLFLTGVRCTLKRTFAFGNSTHVLS